MPDAQGNDQQISLEDALSQLFGSIPGPNQPSPALLPGMPGAPPSTSSMPVSGPRMTPVPYAVKPAVTSLSPAAPAKASDDPALSMPALPATPSFRSPDLLNQRLATRAAIEDVNRAHANDYRDNRPHWYDRLLGGVAAAGTAAVTGDQKIGEKVGDKIVNRRFNRADQERQRELAPLFRSLNAQKEDEPFYKVSDEASQRSFEDKRQNAVEQRNQVTAEAKTEYQNALNDIKQQMADNKHDEALARIKELQSRLDERAQHNQDWLQVQNDLLELKSKALDLKQQQSGNKRSQTLFDKIQKDKAAAEAKADRDFAAATMGMKPDSPDYQQALGNKVEAYRAAQANYEQRIENAGGEPDHIEYDESGVARNDAGTPTGPARSTAASRAKPGPQTPAPAAQPSATVENFTLTKPLKPGTPLTDKKIAKQYLDAAKGDKAKARELAKADGWKF